MKELPPSTQSDAPPPGWGDDELTKFLNAGKGNQWATFYNKRPAMAKLISIDGQFFLVSKDWLNPQSEISAFLLLRCHGAFRAASGLAMSGQLVEAYALCRSMLEYAAYAVHVYRNPASGMIWLNRHKDDAAMRAQKKEFLLTNVWASVRAANLHACQRAEELYQFTIDFGGHPNERAVTGSMKMVDEPGKRAMLAILQHGDGVELDLALKRVAQCGMVSLEMLQIVFNARFELLGINAAMLVLRSGL
jgi:hypothetical protein